MDKEDILGFYLKDVRPYFPNMEIVEVEKNGVNKSLEEDGDNVIKVRTQDNIIIEIVE